MYTLKKTFYPLLSHCDELIFISLYNFYQLKLLIQSETKVLNNGFTEEL